MTLHSDHLKHLFTLNPFIARYKKQLILGILFIALSNFFRILQPQMIREALDQIVAFIKMDPASRSPEQLTEGLMYFGLMVLGFALLMGVFMYFMRQTIIVMSRLIEYDLRKKIFDHYLSLDSGFYRSNKTGDIMSRISEDVNKVRMYLGPAFLYGFNLITLFIIVIATMFKVNFWLSVYTLIPLPILSFIIYKVSNLIHQRSARIQSQLGVITSIAQEAYSGIRIIKSFNREADWKKKFSKQSDQYSRLALDLAKVDALFFPSMYLLIGLSTLITIYMGGLDVYHGTVTAGNIAEFVIYINMLTWPVSAIGWCASIIQQAEASQKRINEFLDQKSAIEEAEKPELFPENFNLKFRNVQFRYNPLEDDAIRELSFDWTQGKHIAIVGRTGSGKSSIAELILRMADAQSGEISISGKEIHSYRTRDLRSNISFVPQDVFLFSDTIRANILFGVDRPDLIQEAEILQLIEDSGLSEELSKFPEGLDTTIGERGVSLSGGQRQRISIARALIKNSRIYILDDCLSAVDAHTEEHILQALKRRLHGASLMLITHRLSQTREMDHILVMDHGKLVEQGSFDELIALKGSFFRMYQIEQSVRKVSEISS